MKPHKTKQSPQKAVDLRKDKRMLRRQEPRRRSSQPSPRPSAAPPRGSAPWTRPQPSGTTSRWGIRRPPPRGFGIPAKSSRETAGRRWGLRKLGAVKGKGEECDRSRVREWSEKSAVGRSVKLPGRAGSA
ncbi:hypothetical protein B296_00058856 [Ensete ventricosum]|uniref:Uncharacterized protein n=1 Tax=Ensete ventricosum TaxID=4639 RepID=A0A426X558_ENSVE|nr:hypothetical protein B296_00058856 [Ensete ventricosum]